MNMKCKRKCHNIYNYHTVGCCQAQESSWISTASGPTSPGLHLHSSVPPAPQHSTLWPTSWTDQSHPADPSQSPASLHRSWLYETSPESECRLGPAVGFGGVSKIPHTHYFHLYRSAAFERGHTRWRRQSTIHSVSIPMSSCVLLQTAKLTVFYLCPQVSCVLLLVLCSQNLSILSQRCGVKACTQSAPQGLVAQHLAEAARYT